jgi:heme A synthase
MGWPGEMKSRGVIFASVAAIGFMIFYHLIPFLFIGGAPDSLAKLWPFSLAGSILSVALGFYQVWRQKQSHVPVGRLSLCVLWFSSATVFGLILFSRAIANVLANALGD